MQKTILLAINQHPLSTVYSNHLFMYKCYEKIIYSINQVKERNLICLLENNVGGGKGAPLSEVFPTTKLLWNLVNGIYLLVV